jgi:hypothetical protein
MKRRAAISSGMWDFAQGYAASPRRHRGGAALARSRARRAGSKAVFRLCDFLGRLAASRGDHHAGDLRGAIRSSARISLEAGLISRRAAAVPGASLARRRLIEARRFAEADECISRSRAASHNAVASVNSCAHAGQSSGLWTALVSWARAGKKKSAPILGYGYAVGQ